MLGFSNWKICVKGNRLRLSKPIAWLVKTVNSYDKRIIIKYKKGVIELKIETDKAQEQKESIVVIYVMSTRSYPKANCCPNKGPDKQQP
jgi:hypothetical protein